MKSIKIGSMKYELKEFTRPIENERVAEIDFRAREIRLEEGLHEDLKTETILHEVVHGILDFFGDDVYVMDERLVSNVSDGVLMVLEDNPELLEMIVERCKGG